MSVEHTAKSSYAFLQKTKTRNLLQNRALTSSAVQFAIDLLLTLSILYALVVNKTGGFSEPYITFTIITTLLMILVYYNKGLYRSHKTLIKNSFSVFRAWLFVTMSLVVIGFITKQSAAFSREVLLVWFFVAGASQVAAHALFRIYMRKLQKSENQAKALIIGAGEVSQYLAERINDNPWLKQNIVGVLDDNAQNLSNWDTKDIPIMGDLDGFDEIVKHNDIKIIYISLPITEMGLLEKLQIESIDKNIEVHWVPPIFDMTLINHSIKQIGNVPLIALSETPLNGQRGNTKKLLDYSLTLLAVIALSPILIATAIAIKLSSKGPVLFKQKRHGMQGEVFNVWKFRSMREHKEGDGEITQATKEDPRITKVGKFIRKTSIDELPQLWNVLNGTMSLVGPRPHAVEHNNFYSDKVIAYMARHNIKPGLTGLAQVNNCRGETKTVEEMARRVEYDLEYINNWSVGLDIKIIFQTVFVLFSDKAY